MKPAFCPRCNNLMKISGGKAIYQCGFEKELNVDEKSHSEKIKRKENTSSTKATKISNERATYPHNCGKCGFEKAEMILSDPWYSDADYNMRFKCGKCGHVERERLSKT